MRSSGGRQLAGPRCVFRSQSGRGLAVPVAGNAAVLVTAPPGRPAIVAALVVALAILAVQEGNPLGNVPAAPVVAMIEAGYFTLKVLTMVLPLARLV